MMIDFEFSNIVCKENIGKNNDKVDCHFILEIDTLISSYTLFGQISLGFNSHPKRRHIYTILQNKIQGKDKVY